LTALHGDGGPRRQCIRARPPPPISESPPLYTLIRTRFVDCCWFLLVACNKSNDDHEELFLQQKKVEPFIRFRSTRMCMVGKRANMTSSARISRSDSGDQRPRARYGSSVCACVVLEKMPQDGNGWSLADGRGCAWAA
jgi:hypothetical protein